MLLFGRLGAEVENPRQTVLLPNRNRHLIRVGIGAAERGRDRYIVIANLLRAESRRIVGTGGIGVKTVPEPLDPNDVAEPFRVAHQRVEVNHRPHPRRRASGAMPCLRRRKLAFHPTSLLVQALLRKWCRVSPTISRVLYLHSLGSSSLGITRSVLM